MFGKYESTNWIDEKDLRQIDDGVINYFVMGFYICEGFIIHSIKYSVKMFVGRILSKFKVSKSSLNKMAALPTFLPFSRYWDYF